MRPSEQKVIKNGVDAIRASLDLLRQRFEDHNRANDHCRKTQHNDNESIVEAIKGIRESDAKRVETNGTEERRHRDNLQQQKTLTKWTAAAFCAAAIYAAIAILQWCQMKKSTDGTEQSVYVACLSAQSARDAFLLEAQSALDSHLASVAAYTQAIAVAENQKAVIVAEISAPPALPYGKQMVMNLSVKNVGKSDATNVAVSGWAIIRQPNSSIKIALPRDRVFEIKGAFLRAGEDVMKDSSGSHPTQIPVFDADTGKPYINTAEGDNDLFVTGKRFIFFYYTLSYEDFFARYSGRECDIQASWDSSKVKPRKGSDMNDPECRNYYYMTQTPKVPMPEPKDNLGDIKYPPEIKCIEPKPYFW